MVRRPQVPYRRDRFTGCEAIQVDRADTGSAADIGLTTSGEVRTRLSRLAAGCRTGIVADGRRSGSTPSDWSAGAASRVSDGDGQREGVEAVSRSAGRSSATKSWSSTTIWPMPGLRRAGSARASRVWRDASRRSSPSGCRAESQRRRLTGARRQRPGGAAPSTRTVPVRRSIGHGQVEDPGEAVTLLEARDRQAGDAQSRGQGLREERRLAPVRT